VKLVTLLLVVLALMLMGCDSTEDTITDVTFNVASVTTAPTLDGNGSDAAWSEATEYVVTLGEGTEHQNEFGVVDLSLTAVRTSTDLYVKAVWDDPSGTENVDKNQWTYADGEWSTGGNEDRLFFFFDMGLNGTEGADCATMCHAVAEDPGMWTTTGKVDQWHWKAARTAPIHHADDKYIDNNYFEDDGVTIAEDGGQHGDSKTIGLYNNNKLNGLPKYAGPETDGFLILPSGQTDDAAYFTAFDTTSTTGSYRGYWLNANADGSRADVTAYSSYNNGTWTVELMRALDTGNDDDVVFPTSGEVEISVAITDNSGSKHSGAPPFNMVF